MEWGWRWDRYYTNTTEIVGSVRPGTLYYKYVRNYFKFNLRRESEVVKIKTMLILFWMTYSWFLWRTKKKCVPYYLWWLFSRLVVVLVCFFLLLTCSQFKILCKFQVYSNVICLYLCVCVCVCVCVCIEYSSLWKFIWIWSDFSF